MSAYYCQVVSSTTTNARLTGANNTNPGGSRLDRDVLIHGLRLVAGSAAAAATVSIVPSAGATAVTLNLAAAATTADEVLLNHPLVCHGDVNLSAISGTGATFTLIYSLA